MAIKLDVTTRQLALRATEPAAPVVTPQQPAKNVPGFEAPRAALLALDPMPNTAPAPSANAASLWGVDVAPLKPFSKEIVKRAIQNTADLVRVRSQGGIDDPAAIVAELKKKVEAAGLTPNVLLDPTGKPVGVTVEIVGARPGPTYVLNAVSDTAPVGDATRWTKDPFGAEVVGNRMYGRGTADSKFAAAMFLEVGRDLASQQSKMKGNLVLFFDAAEHTGKFEGVRAFLEKYPQPAGVMIGYPGDDAVYVGSRGFYRSQVTASVTPGDAAGLATALRTTERLELPGKPTEGDFPLAPKATATALETLSRTAVATPKHRTFSLAIAGKAAHSGSSSNPGVNAIGKAAQVLEKLSVLAKEQLGGSALVASLGGGIDYALVPDRIELSVVLPDAPGVRALVEQALAHVDAAADAGAPSTVMSEAPSAGTTEVVSSVKLNVDMRVVPSFDGEKAEAGLRSALQRGSAPGLTVSLAPTESWPAFQLKEGDPLRDALVKAVNLPRVGMKQIPARVSGPSNIGNLLASKGISATTGYGIESSGAHVPDEWIDLSTAPQVMHNVRVAVRDLMDVTG